MSRKKDSTHSPTDLEAAVLGTLWREGPCTAYVVRKSFVDSPSPKWSGSAGAIYPLLKRLEEKKLIHSTTNDSTKRKQRDYKTTRQGMVVFRRWLQNLDFDNDLGLVHDPLRLKILFLEALPAKESIQLVERAIEGIQTKIVQLKLDCNKNTLESNPGVYFASRNALLLTKARLTWLNEMASHFSKSV